MSNKVCRTLALAALALLMVPASALADGIHFGFSGGTVTANTALSNWDTPATLNLVNSVLGALGRVKITTGEINDALDPNPLDTIFYFDGGGRIRIVADNAPELPIDERVFDGEFSGPSIYKLIGFDPSSGLATFEFSGPVAGHVKQVLLDFLGLSGFGTHWSGTATFTVSFIDGAIEGSFGSGTIHLNQAAEPGTLLLLGGGLLGVAVVFRRKS